MLDEASAWELKVCRCSATHKGVRHWTRRQSIAIGSTMSPGRRDPSERDRDHANGEASYDALGTSEETRCHLPFSRTKTTALA